MINRSKETYLWYFPDGTPSSRETSTSPDATPTDGWGSSTMLYALFEGLAGVEDRQKLFQVAKLSPRWTAAGVCEAEVRMGYANSGAEIGYLYRIKADCLYLEVECSRSELDFHILLPKHFAAKTVLVDNKEIEFDSSRIEKSFYVDFCLSAVDKTSIEILLLKGD